MDSIVDIKIKSPFLKLAMANSALDCHHKNNFIELIKKTPQPFHCGYKETRSEMSGHLQESYSAVQEGRVKGNYYLFTSCSEHKVFLQVFPASPGHLPWTPSTDCSDLVNALAVSQSPNGWNKSLHWWLMSTKGGKKNSYGSSTFLTVIIQRINTR